MGRTGLNIWKRSANIGLRVFIVAVAVTCTVSPVSQALQSVFIAPNPAEMIQDSNGNPDNSIGLVLKDTPTSAIREIKMAAYMDTPAAGTTFTIYDRDNAGERCEIYQPAGVIDPYVQVTFTVQTAAGPSSITYDIASNMICNGTQNSSNTAANNTNARFFGTYDLPAGLPATQVDPLTGLYRVEISIAYGAGVGQGPTGGQLISFKSRIDNSTCTTPSCVRFLSMVPIGSGSNRNYSTIGRHVNRHVTNEQFKFGLPCNQNLAQEFPVNVYDIDNGLNGGYIAWFSIERRVGNAWVAESFDLNTKVTGENTAQSTPTRIQPLNGSAQTTTVLLTMQPFTNYRLTVNNIYSTNLVGIGLPTETIFGSLDCDADLDGGIAIDPIGVNPVNDGEQVTLTPQTTRNGTIDFPSVFNYTWRTWFDDGDEKYQAGEDTACAVVTQNSYLHASSGTQNLPTACTTTANSSKSGGRAANVCGQLILTAVDPFTNIGAGSGVDGLIRCVAIGKFPHLEARNGDVFTGGEFQLAANPTCVVANQPVISSSSRQIPAGTGPFYTSYGTYGVTSLGMSKTFGSNDFSYDATAPVLADDLVFANTSNDDGYFFSRNSDSNNFPIPSLVPTGGLKHCLNDPFFHFGSRPTATDPGVDIDISTLPGDTLLTASGKIIFLKATAPINKKIIIYANSSVNPSDIHITSDITYANGPYTSIDQLPQVVIMTNGHIQVFENVARLDGIYAAKKNIYTCNLIPRLHLCGKQLTINGAVIAGENVIPLRTAGADAADLGAMAEIFNLRPDVLLGQVPDQGSPGTFLKTMSETEVPARF